MWWQWLLGAAGAIIILTTAGAKLIQIGTWADRNMKRVSQFLDDWQGESQRPGFPAVLGVMARLENIETRLNKVETQFKPNGHDGASLRDVIDRIEHEVAPAGLTETES